MCVLGGGGPPAPRPHGEPAGDVQNPKHPRWDTGASGGDAADGLRRQRPDLHLHLPVHIQSLHYHADRAAAAAGQVGQKSGGAQEAGGRGRDFECALLDSLAGTEVWKNMSKTRADVRALRPTELSESEAHSHTFVLVCSTWTIFDR